MSSLQLHVNVAPGCLDPVSSLDQSIKDNDAPDQEAEQQYQEQGFDHGGEIRADRRAL